MVVLTRILIFVLIAGLAPQTATAKSVEKEFAEAWAERVDRYAHVKEQAKADFKPAYDGLEAAAKGGAEQAKQALVKLFDASHALGYNAAREDTLRTLMGFMTNKPSAVRAELWLEDRADNAKTEADRAKSASASAAAMKLGDNGATGADMLNAAVQAVFGLGAAQGRVDELQTIDSNLASFYRAKGEQDTRRRTTLSGILGAIGQGLRDSAQQNQGWTAQCSTIGQFTNCSGN